MLISPSSLLLFIAGAIVILLIPGPAVTFIVSRSIEHGRKAGLVSVLGIVTATLFHVTAATLGISALIASSAHALQFVKYAGAVYIVYLGIRTLRRSDTDWFETGQTGRHLALLYGQGFLVNLLNPKTIIFFLSFLPQFVDPSRGHPTLQVFQLGILFVFLSICCDSGYAFVAGDIGRRIRGNARLRRIERTVSGTLLIVLGVACAFVGARAK
jgi:threonine/homoserine/homoserine lactone efflux protein